eukprot:scaffold1954_cov268-Pinguiococcus_pyrenoidosus.AAC.9
MAPLPVPLSSTFCPGRMCNSAVTTARSKAWMICVRSGSAAAHSSGVAGSRSSHPRPFSENTLAPKALPTKLSWRKRPKRLSSFCPAATTSGRSSWRPSHSTTASPTFTRRLRPRLTSLRAFKGAMG